MTSEQPSGGNGNPDMQSMAALLEEETAAYPELRRGEIIEGVVVGTDRDGILVDIGAKSEGVVPPSEMHCLQPEGASRLNTGDKVLVFIVQPESQEGQIILSLDRARGERGWRVLQDYLDGNQSFEGYVTGSNKGGLLVNVEGVNAFVPLSQIVAGPERGSPENTQRALSEWVGRNITLKVIELNRRRNRAILSERAAVQERRAADKERLLLELSEGDVKTGRITSIRDFGIFVDIGGADGLVHLSELSWERTPKSPHEMFKVGDEVPVYVLKVDNETKKIALSVRRAQPERWEEIVSRYREGQIVPGQITKLAPFGAFVRLEGPIEGLIHISELVDRRINHPKEVLQEGDVVPVKIVRIEYDRHRLGLSLRQARDRAEEDGWVFNEAGGPTRVPQDVLDQLGVEAPEPRAETETAYVSEAAPDAEDLTPPAAAADVTEIATEPPEEAVAAEATEPEPETAPEAEATEPEPEAAPEAEATEPEPEAAPEVEATEPEPEAAPEAEAPEPEPEAAPEAEATEPEPDAAPEAEAVEPEPEAVAEPESPEVAAIESETPVETESAAEEEPAPDAEPEPDLAAEAEAEPTAETEIETEMRSEAPAEAEPEPEQEEEQPAMAEVEDEAPAEEQEQNTAAEPEAPVTQDAPDALNKVEEG